MRLTVSAARGPVGVPARASPRHLRLRRPGLALQACQDRRAGRSSERSECGRELAGGGITSERNRCGLPPYRMPLKELLGNTPFVLIPGDVWKFLVSTDDNDGRPLVIGAHLVHFEAHERILSHPFDFLPQCGEAVEVRVVKVDVNGNDVRLVVQCARETSEVCARQYGPAFRSFSSSITMWGPHSH